MVFKDVASNGDWIDLKGLFQWLEFVSYLVDRWLDFLNCWLELLPYKAVHIWVNRVFQDQRGDQVGEVLVLRMLHAYLDLQLVEPDDGIMHQCHKALNLLHDLLEQELVDSGWLLYAWVHLVERKVLLYFLLSCLDKVTQDLSEEVFQCYDWVSIHRGQVHANNVELGRVFWFGWRWGDAQTNDVMLQVVLKKFLLLRKWCLWGGNRGSGGKQVLIHLSARHAKSAYFCVLCLLTLQKHVHIFRVNWLPILGWETLTCWEMVQLSHGHLFGLRRVNHCFGEKGLTTHFEWIVQWVLLAQCLVNNLWGHIIGGEMDVWDLTV